MFEYIDEEDSNFKEYSVHTMKVNYKETINRRSSNSDLTIIGFRDELVKKQKLDIFEGYNSLGNILFVNSIDKKNIE